jgi:antimicrobial peptide system SdpA family protein
MPTVADLRRDDSVGTSSPILLVVALRLIFFVAWAGLGVAACIGSVGESPYQPGRSMRTLALALAPQGWGFFTKSPREPSQRFYRVGPAGLERIDYPNASFKALGGISRSARAFSLEAAPLLIQIPKSDWRECTVQVEKCAVAASEFALKRVRNTSRLRQLCGRILIDERPPVPWAWSSRRPPDSMPGRLVEFLSDCSQPNA